MAPGGVARGLAKALKWPPFLLSILLLYWSVCCVALTYHLKWLRFKGRRNDVYSWAAGMKFMFRYRVLKVGNGQLYTGKAMYLCNHRSWADFLVDQYVTMGHSLFLSRWAVFFVFPTFMSAIRAIKSVILFKRGSIADKQGFNKWIDEEFEDSPQSALSVYPEGHRSMHGESLPLKRGMLHYAFSRSLPVQVVISSNKEAIIAEKHCTARFGQTVAVGYSEVVDPKQFSDFESFMTRVQQEWDNHWRFVFSADWTGMPELQVEWPDSGYPLSIRLKMLGAVLFNFCLGSAVAVMSFRFWRWCFSLFGPLEPVALALAAAYLTASFWVYSRPVDALVLHGKSERPPKPASQSEGSLANGDVSGALKKEQ